MKFTFLGAARSVTGSCHMVETNGLKILVDCGLRQGRDAKQELGEGEFLFDPKELDFVLLTHAHIDHSGLLPLLVKKGYKGRIICTKATAELVEIMLIDSGHIHEVETEWKNRKNARAGRPFTEPLYTAKEAMEVAGYLTTVEYGQIYDLNENVRMRFTDAGHLLGSASIEFYTVEDGREIKTVFSGDIGNKNKPIINDPVYMDSADYVVMETTYGDRNHKDTRPLREQLKEILTGAIKRGGNIVIPSFAVGRTQDVLYEISVLLKEGGVPGLEDIPVYLDSPLAIQATEIFKKKYLGYYDEEAREYLKKGVKFFGFKTLKIAQTADESKQINFLEEQKIIISASGMCEAGRIKHHLKHNLWRADSTILFVGYQAADTLGRIILDGQKKVKIFNESIHVNADIKMIEGFSCHADRDGLLEWLGHFNKPVKRVFLVHGEEKVIQKFAKDLGAVGYTVSVPKLNDSYDTESESITAVKKAARPNIVLRLENMLKNIAAAVHTEMAKGGEDKLLQIEDDLKDFIEKYNNDLFTKKESIK